MSAGTSCLSTGARWRWLDKYFKAEISISDGK